MNNREKHTKFSLEMRRLAVERVLMEGWSVTASAVAISASRSIVYRWIRRYKHSGLSGLEERTSRPHRFPNQLSAVIVQAIRLLREARLSLGQIAWQLKLVRSTIWRWLRRLGLSRLPRPPQEPVVRYEAGQPGELLHIDIKKLRGFTHPGRKFIEDGGRRWRGAPRQYLHVCVDSRSRYAYALVLPRENADACIHFLEQAIAHFAGLGVKVQRILTDNGSAYRGKEMAVAIERLGIRHSFTRVRRPQTNGKAERFIRTAMDEWGYVKYENSELRDAALPGWLKYYNHHRSHSALGHKPPVTRLALSTTC